MKIKEYDHRDTQHKAFYISKLDTLFIADNLDQQAREGYKREVRRSKVLKVIQRFLNRKISDLEIDKFLLMNEKERKQWLLKKALKETANEFVE